MQNKINALFVIPSLSRAGAEAQLVDLINGFDDNRYDKTLLVFGDNLDQLEKINTKAIKFIHLPRKNKWDVSIVLKLARVIDDNGIQLIHSTLSISALFSWLGRMFSRGKPKLVATVHTTINRSSKEEFWEKWVYARVLAACDKVIFVCQNQFNHWASKYPKLNRNSVVVHNGVDTDYFSVTRSIEDISHTRRELNIPVDARVLCCIAAFRPEKGHLDLLSVFAQLDGEPHLILAGDGALRSSIEEKIQQLALQDRVHLLGIVSDVRPVLASSDITVLASTAVETFSIAMLESLSMGVPVVCSDIGGLSEAVVSGKTGELFPAGDSQALLAKLQYLLANKELLQQMCLESAQSVRVHFSKDLMIEKTDKILSAQINQ